MQVKKKAQKTRNLFFLNSFKRKEKEGILRGAMLSKSRWGSIKALYQLVYIHEDFLIIYTVVDWQLTSMPINRRIIPGAGWVDREKMVAAHSRHTRRRREEGQRKKKVNLFFRRLPTVIAFASVCLFGKSCKLEQCLDGRRCEERELIPVGWNRKRERMNDVKKKKR